jgi:hypothetical protein
LSQRRIYARQQIQHRGEQGGTTGHFGSFHFNVLSYAGRICSTSQKIIYCAHKIVTGRDFDCRSVHLKRSRMREKTDAMPVIQKMVVSVNHICCDTGKVVYREHFIRHF